MLGPNGYRNVTVHVILFPIELHVEAPSKFNSIVSFSANEVLFDSTANKVWYDLFNENIGNKIGSENSD